MKDLAHAVRIRYRNHRGEESSRRIVPIRIHFMFNEWHPEPQWILEAFDLDKHAPRNFAIRDILKWKT